MGAPPARAPGQYRRLTHAHAAAAGVTRQGSSGTYLPDGHKRSKRGRPRPAAAITSIHLPAPRRSPDAGKHPSPPQPAPARGGKGPSSHHPRQSHAVAHDFYRGRWAPAPVTPAARLAVAATGDGPGGDFVAGVTRMKDEVARAAPPRTPGHGIPAGGRVVHDHVPEGVIEASLINPTTVRPVQRTVSLSRPCTHSDARPLTGPGSGLGFLAADYSGSCASLAQ